MERKASKELLKVAGIFGGGQIIFGIFLLNLHYVHASNSTSLETNSFYVVLLFVLIVSNVIWFLLHILTRAILEYETLVKIRYMSTGAHTQHVKECIMRFKKKHQFAMMVINFFERN